MSRLLARCVLPAYLILVLAALVIAILRLNQSIEMPGLGAIELVLLAMPWSLALGAEPLSHLGFRGMAAIVIVGLVLNGLILSWLTAWLQRLVEPPNTR